MMLKENIRIAKEVLDGMSLSDAAKEYGKSRGRIWQITRAFCLEYLMHHQLYNDDGKMRDLKGLRYQWRTMLHV